MDKSNCLKACSGLIVTNFFKYDPDYNNKEAEWNEIKKEILGEYGDALVQGAGKMKDPDDPSDTDSSGLYEEKPG